MSTSAQDLTNWSQPVTLTLRNGAASVRSARRFTSDLLSRWGLAERRDDVLLCLSELVSNAVVYSQSEVSLQVSRAGSELRLEVFDVRPLDERFAAIVQARKETHAHHPMLPPVEGGRGLLLVDELSQAWGVKEINQGDGSQGKIVWCVLGAETQFASPPASASGATTADPEPTAALLLQVPTRYLMAQERRLESVRRALQATADTQAEHLALIQRIDEAHREHLASRLQPPVEVDRAAFNDRLDLAFDGAVGPYRSAVDLVEAISVARSALGAPLPASGLSGEDLDAFDDWYIGELGRQAAGADPVPCPFPARTAQPAL
ncbi:MAG: putative anti-sigma regulatory factor serine/threonine protein kinase [Acidimicrobiia bacterium]|nr:putative anti-sigma regulatory factor serine/threonine protein kinase [Acidimicrobiia bacterium]